MYAQTYCEHVASASADPRVSDPTHPSSEADMASLLQLLNSELQGKQIPPMRKERPRRRAADIVIITALPTPEGEELRKAFGVDAPGRPHEFVEGIPFYTRRLLLGGTEMSIVIASQVRMGMVDAAILSAKALLAWEPAYLIMTGICAGIQGKVSLGDVVIADEVFDYGSGKLVGKRLHPEFHFAPMHPTLCALLKDFATRTDVLAEVHAQWSHAAGRPGAAPRAHVGPMASGAAVVASKATVKGIVEHKRKLLAVDMEAYGVAQAAAHMLDGRARFIVCKSVSDYADATKSDDIQEYCSMVSASFIRRFLEENGEHLFAVA